MRPYSSSRQDDDEESQQEKKEREEEESKTCVIITWDAIKCQYSNVMCIVFYIQSGRQSGMPSLLNKTRTLYEDVSLIKLDKRYACSF